MYPVRVEPPLLADDIAFRETLTEVFVLVVSTGAAVGALGREAAIMEIASVASPSPRELMAEILKEYVSPAEREDFSNSKTDAEVAEGAAASSEYAEFEMEVYTL